MKRILLVLALLALAGCYWTVYEPTVCVEERIDTVAVFLDDQDRPTGHVVVERTCVVWQAFNDSTKRWDNQGRRLP